MSSVPFFVAINTFRESVRDRVLYNLIFFALLMMAAAVLVGQISIGIERLVIINLGLSAISLLGLVMSVFIGVGLVYKEIERRTLYSILAKPVHRWQFLTGKYLGLLLTLAINTALMTLGLYLALIYVDRSIAAADAQILLAVYFILLEFALVTALALFFSCFSTPMLSTLYTLGLYVAGVFASDVRAAGALSKNGAVKAVTAVIYYVLPNFSNFNIIGATAHGDAIHFSLVWQNTAYAAIYILALLLAASAVFSNRNLK
jgi:Cu-processing system permease protein